MDAKKKILIGIGAAVIVAVFVAVVLIIAIGPGNTPDEPKTVELEGTWLVTQYAEFPKENIEYMIFENGRVKYYNDITASPRLEGAYTYADGTVEIENFQHKMTVKIISDNFINLVEPDTRDWKLVRIAPAGEEPKKLTAADIIGTYDLVRVAGNNREGNEVIEITETSFKDTRNGAVAMDSAYSVTDGNTFYADDMKQDFRIYKIGNDILLIQGHGDGFGHVWELIKK